ncbi:MAG: hypothetical protein HeimC3_20920 [Candidatus Heimdallarchaeota archaeon LC_3]|nr:MAG: hypothetical protein HeimC3_20920 [Candidatus Heimdallarchaeota archaeon LC_3]
MDEDQKQYLIKIIGVILIIVGFYLWMTYGGSQGLIGPIYVIGAVMALFGAYLALFYGRVRSRDLKDR